MPEVESPTFSKGAPASCFLFPLNSNLHNTEELGANIPYKEATAH